MRGVAVGVANSSTHSRTCSSEWIIVQLIVQRFMLTLPSHLDAEHVGGALLGVWPLVSSVTPVAGTACCRSGEQQAAAGGRGLETRPPAGRSKHNNTTPTMNMPDNSITCESSPVLL